MVSSMIINLATVACPAFSQSREEPTLPRALNRLPPEVQELILDHIYASFIDERRAANQLRASRRELYLTIKVLAECLPRWRSVALKKWPAIWATSESDWAEGAESNVRYDQCPRGGI